MAQQQGKRVSGRPGTGFISFSDWANANAAGGQRLADTLAGNADAAGSAAQRRLGNLRQQFGDAVNDGTLRYDPLGLDSGRANYLSNEGYVGPNSMSEVEGYESAMAAAQRAQEGAGRLGDLYGRATTLQDTYGKGRDYSGQMALLDSALAGKAGGGRFAQLQQQWGGLVGKAQGMERDALSTASAARQSSANAAQEYGRVAPVIQREEQATRDRADNEFLNSVEEGIWADERRRPGSRITEGRNVGGGGKRRGTGGRLMDDWGSNGTW